MSFCMSGSPAPSHTHELRGLAVLFVEVTSWLFSMATHHSAQEDAEHRN